MEGDDGFPCHEDDVLTDAGCYNFEEVPVEVTILADYCTQQGDTWCEGTLEAPRVEQPVTELARTGMNEVLFIVALVLIVGGSLIKLGLFIRTQNIRWAPWVVIFTLYVAGVATLVAR